MLGALSGVADKVLGGDAGKLGPFEGRVFGVGPHVLYNTVLREQRNKPRVASPANLMRKRNLNRKSVQTPSRSGSSISLKASALVEDNSALNL